MTDLSRYHVKFDPYLAESVTGEVTRPDVLMLAEMIGLARR